MYHPYQPNKSIGKKKICSSDINLHRDDKGELYYIFIVAHGVTQKYKVYKII